MALRLSRNAAALAVESWMVRHGARYTNAIALPTLHFTKSAKNYFQLLCPWAERVLRVLPSFTYAFPQLEVSTIYRTPLVL